MKEAYSIQTKHITHLQILCSTLPPAYDANLCQTSSGKPKLLLTSSRDSCISSEWPLIKIQLCWTQRVASICKFLLYQHECLVKCCISSSLQEELHTLVCSLYSCTTTTQHPPPIPTQENQHFINTGKICQTLSESRLSGICTTAQR